MRFVIIGTDEETKTIDTKKKSRFTTTVKVYDSFKEGLNSFHHLSLSGNYKVLYFLVDFETCTTNLSNLFKINDDLENDKIDLPYFIICQYIWDNKENIIRTDRTQIIIDGITREFNNNIKAMHIFMKSISEKSNVIFNIAYKRKVNSDYDLKVCIRKIADSKSFADKKSPRKRFLIHPPTWIPIIEDEIIKE